VNITRSFTPAALPSSPVLQVVLDVQLHVNWQGDHPSLLSLVFSPGGGAYLASHVLLDWLSVCSGVCSVPVALYAPSYGVAQGTERWAGHTHTSAPQVPMRDHAGVCLPTPARHCVIPFLTVIFFSHRGMLTCVRSLVTQARAQSSYR